MRFRRLDLLRYGHFTDRSFELPVSSFDFHIVFGPNEAGKSTTLSAIEDLLFGIPMHSPYNFLHDYTSMRIGAVLENGASSLEVIRRKGSKDTLLGIDNLPVAGGEGALRPFLAGADRSFFQRMFCLDRIRLESGGREILEAKDEIGQMLFSAGAGIAGLRDRLTKLSNEADELWAAKKAKHRKYYQADDKLKEAERELRQQTFTANKWHELKRAFKVAQDAYANIETEFEKVSAEGKQLSRIRRVYRYVRRKTELDKQIEALGVVISLPEDAQKVLMDSERKESEASTRIDTLSGQLEKAREELEGLTYDEQLVLRGDDVRQLHERRIEIRREKADLPKRQAELNAAEKELRALAAELGWHEEEVSALIARIPARAKVGTVRSLHGQRGELVSEVTNKTETMEEAKAECSELKDRLDGMRETIDVSRLEAVVRTVRESGDIAGRLRSAEQHLKDAQKRTNRLLASLHPSVPSEKDAAEMQVPPRMGVQSHRDQVQDWERRTRETGQKIETAEQELNRGRKAFQSAARDEHAITAGELEEVRDRRDALWGLVKRKHIENMAVSEEESLSYIDALDDLAAAFEPAMRTADELADRRFENAEAAGRLAEMSRTIGEQEENIDHLHKQEETLTKEGERLNADWQAMWDKAPFEPLVPDAMLEWLETRGDLLEAIERQAEAISALESQHQEEHEAKESLLMELAALGIDRTALENDALPLVLERADGFRHEYELEARSKVQLEKSFQDAATNIDRRRRELARAKTAWSEWQGEWSTALTDLGLATDLGPDAIVSQVDVIDQMREKAGRINDLRHQRIDKIKRNVADFETVVNEVVQELATDLSDTAADDAVLEIEKRLAEAQRISDLQASKRKEVEGVEKNVGAFEEDRRKARESVNHLQEAAGTDTIDALKSAIEKSDALRTLQGELDATLQTLEQEGDGLAVADLEGECDAIDIDQIAAREETTAIELKALRDQLTTAAEVRSQARGAFQAIGGDDAAARAEAVRQEALAEIRQVAERYVRVRTSAMLLQWAIDRYRREKQAPLLKRAGELFTTITGGAFSALGVHYDDKDEPHLTGLRPDGEVVSVPGMSTGTEDPLFLALRLSSIEDYLERASALPFIADDLFINFDNDRAGAGFQVLGELAKKTQVLFFTHHEHLVDIARETLGGSLSVVSLNDEHLPTTA